MEKCNHSWIFEKVLYTKNNAKFLEKKVYMKELLNFKKLTMSYKL